MKLNSIMLQNTWIHINSPIKTYFYSSVWKVSRRRYRSLISPILKILKLHLSDAKPWSDFWGRYDSTRRSSNDPVRPNLQLASRYKMQVNFSQKKIMTVNDGHVLKPNYPLIINNYTKFIHNCFKQISEKS